MSDPHSSPTSEGDRDAEHERSSGEELLESEQRVKEADRMERTERPAQAEPTAEEEAADDAEDVESEWHFWLLAAVVVIGIALFFAPRLFLPELVGTLGAFLVLIGALGWVVKWAIGRSA